MSHSHELIQSLRASGYRLTPQRAGVLAVLADSNGHLTADEILERVRQQHPYLNKSAVYRSLDLLTELGIVTQTDLGHGHIEYELQQHPHHHHLVCKQCKSVKRIDHAAFAALERKLTQQYGFQARLDHFAIFGTCARCAAPSAPTKRRAPRAT